jgi:hypothetical protein
MHNSGTLEETTLTQNTNEQEVPPNIPETTSPLEPEAASPEMQEQEVTALVPTEPDVIEGEVVEIEPPEQTADHTPPKQKPYWVCIPFTIFLCLLLLAGSYLVPLFTPWATVTLIPVERTITTTHAIQVQGRSLPPLTISQSITTSATGKRHQNARQAHGTITFYNGSFSSQTIAAGTILTGKDGIQVITDQVAIIPAGNPPIYGHVTVLAHALMAGEQGNIPAYAIHQACCATSVLAKNTRSFSDGAEARDFIVATRTDINTAVTSLHIPLRQSEDAALRAQLHHSEDLIPPSCTPHVSSNHQPGDEAKQVTVTVAETCSGIAYDVRTLYAIATQLLTSDTTRNLGASYRPIGDIQVTIVHATITTSRQGQTQMLVHITGTWVYQITPAVQQQLRHLIAGKPRQQARATLIHIPGIAGAQITMEGGNQTLPEDPGAIRILVQYRAV